MDRGQAWNEIMRNFTPVFHHFFLERFQNPDTWYNNRIRYTRSVAVSSMIGYVLGIGDRHSMNVLIKNDTAEVVHIDFGITFDQGKRLRTPETVPFRLTRDLVDGMGMGGCDGLFSYCSERTLDVLRLNRSTVLTILEVMLYDPLCSFAISPWQAMQMQRENDVDVEEDGVNVPMQNNLKLTQQSDHDAHENMNDKSAAAEAALRGVRQKLQGYEDPNGDAMSVEGQVKLLIMEAQNPINLQSLYHGWAPWV